MRGLDLDVLRHRRRDAPVSVDASRIAVLRRIGSGWPMGCVSAMGAEVSRRSPGFYRRAGQIAAPCPALWRTSTGFLALCGRVGLSTVMPALVAGIHVLDQSFK
jgi:hypothetical protein